MLFKHNKKLYKIDRNEKRALFIIDKKGIIRYGDVHNINQRPPLENLVRELQKLN
jgi:peroxiredoxin (alkyl hydroperoxide reductase subunit C)